MVSLYILDKGKKEPLHIQLYNEIKKEIIENLKVGQKLPSIRQVCELYNISKTTVQNAYSQLYAEGYIESKPKSGYFVSDFNYIEFNTKVKSTPKKPKQSDIYDFAPVGLDSSLFPIKTFKRLLNSTLKSNIDFGKYPDGQGEIELRERLSTYLGKSRGLSVSSENIIVTSGFIDSMRLIATLLKPTFKEFAIEHPGYYIAKEIFKSFDYKIENIDMTKDGANLEQFKQCDAKLLYITPSHQYPMGVTMPISKRTKLLEIIESKNGYILEDDYDSELKYNSRPIPSLQGLNSKRVIYLGTFAKSLSPAMRVAFVVLPPNLMHLYQNSYESHFAKVSLPIQLALTKFLEDGYYDRFLKRVRSINRQKHDAMIKAINIHLGKDFKIITRGGGLAILIEAKSKIDYQKLQEEAQKNGIKIYLTKPISNSSFEAIRMGFGGFDIDEIDKGVKAFSKVL